jgi:hypothetical protein
VDPNLAQCPLCGSELSNIKLKEIQSKLDDEKKRNAVVLSQAEAATRERLEQQFKLELEKQKHAAEKGARQEAEEQIKKAAAELNLTNRRLKEAQEREGEVRKQAQQELEKAKIVAEKKAKEEAAAQLKKSADERDLMARKLKEAEEREVATQKRAAQEIEKQKQAAEKKASAEVERQVKKIADERDLVAKKLKDSQEREADLLKRAKEDAEKQLRKELAEQRQVLEKDKMLTLLKQETKFNRELESVQKKMQLMEKQIQRKTANELGDGAEIDLFEALRESFPGDKITRIPKGQAGADILQEVLYKGEPCGKIILDSKNRQRWGWEFVTKLRQDQVEAGAEHSILATTVFPAGKKEMCIESDVIVMAPARIIYVVQILRRAMVTMHVKGLSAKERTTKMSRLYNLIISESYSGRFAEANKLTQDIDELGVQEIKDHGNLWKKRGALLKRIQNVLRETETEVSAIIESSDGDAYPPTLGVKSVHNVSGGARTQERV